jgi:tRNA(Ser,Leu) C12 N-acetylase TAN1
MFVYNLLVTFHGNQKGHSEREVRERLTELGAYVERLETCEVEGVFLIQAGGDAKVLVSQLKRLCHEDPVGFQYTHHWVPIESWVGSRKETIREAAEEMGKGIGESETWMMHLHKRHFDEHYDDLIAYLTDPLNRGTVDLEDPDRILAVEILGMNTGLSLLTRHELLDVNKVRVESGHGKV